MNEQWVCLWSARQNSLHIETLEDMLRTNVRACAENRPLDYVPLVIGNKDQAEAWANRVRGTLIARAGQEAACA